MSDQQQNNSSLMWIVGIVIFFLIVGAGSGRNSSSSDKSNKQLLNYNTSLKPGGMNQNDWDKLKNAIQEEFHLSDEEVEVSAANALEMWNSND